MKNILITGASGNLGTATLKYFELKGYRVIIDKDDKDLTNEDNAKGFVSEAINKAGNIDAALLLVGGFVAGDLSQTSGETIIQQIQLNFLTAFNIVKPLVEHMRAQGHGRIVFIGARPVLEPKAGMHMVAYSLSKSLLFTLADQINAEESPISAAVVVPGTIDTKVNRQSMPDADFTKWVKPEHIAAMLESIVTTDNDSFRRSVLKVFDNG